MRLGEHRHESRDRLLRRKSPTDNEAQRSHTRSDLLYKLDVAATLVAGNVLRLLLASELLEAPLLVARKLECHRPHGLRRDDLGSAVVSGLHVDVECGLPRGVLHAGDHLLERIAPWHADEPDAADLFETRAPMLLRGVADGGRTTADVRHLEDRQIETRAGSAAPAGRPFVSHSLDEALHGLLEHLARLGGGRPVSEE